jgi:hypothetical protein
MTEFVFSYGSTLIISDPVQCIEKDEDLEEFAKFYEYVCKIWKEIEVENE